MTIIMLFTTFAELYATEWLGKVHSPEEIKKGNSKDLWDCVKRFSSYLEITTIQHLLEGIN